MLNLSLDRISTGFDGASGTCYVHARGAVLPDGRTIVTTQKLNLKGCDDFNGLETLVKPAPTAPWSAIRPSGALARRRLDAERDIAVCDATPFFHHATGRLLLTGHTVVYQTNASAPDALRSRHTAWSVFDDDAGQWRPYQLLNMPAPFANCGAGSTQIHECPDGTLLIPAYTLLPDKQCYGTLVMRCAFDGDTLTLVETGNILTCPAPRGLYEPSIARHDGTFFLCMRNDLTSYAATSPDGIHFTHPVEWLFDDGSPLGSYNTQQHWAALGGKLYLIYTRKGADNDHVFRHRAPLFVAEVDTERLRIRRETEQVAVPERGARLGNFGCCNVDDDTAVIFASEWMQTIGPDHADYRRCMSYGSDNSIFAVTLHP